MKLNFSYQFAKGFVNEEEMKQIKLHTELANEILMSKTGAGNDYLGWISLPEDYDKEEFARIKKAAEKIGLKIESAEIEWVPKNYVSITDTTQEEAVFKFLEQLEDLDDVQDVYPNIGD